MNFQAAVTAIAIAYMLRGRPARWLENLVHDLIISVEAETGRGGDDIRLELGGGEIAEIQVKKGLRATEELWSALLAIAQAIASAPNIFGILIVCPDSSSTVRSALARDIVSIGAGQTDNLSDIGKLCHSRMLSAGLDPVAICARLRIKVIAALEAQQGDIQAVRAELGHICASPEDIETAWKTLYVECDRLIERRGRHDKASAETLLRAVPIALAIDAPRANWDREAADALAGRFASATPHQIDLSALGKKLLGEEAERKSEYIRQARYFSGFPTLDETRRFAMQLSEGEFASCAPDLRARLLGNCARWLAYKGELTEITPLVALSQQLGSSDETLVGAASLASRTDLSAGLQMLGARGTPYTRSAALQMMVNAKGLDEALAWMVTAGITFETLDSDGRYLLTACHIDARDWEKAHACAAAIDESDTERTPILHHVLAVSYLIQAVPQDLRPLAVNGIPLDAATFALDDMAAAIAARRLATYHFRSAEKAARGFSCDRVARVNAQYALWLELRDPETATEALATLAAMLEVPEVAIAFVPLAIAFDLPIDVGAVETEIARRMAFAPDGDVDIAVARLALVQTRGEAKEALDYFEAHKSLMLRHLAPAGLLDIEVHLLVANERYEQARERLATDGHLLPSALQTELARIADRGKGGLETKDHEEAYANSPDLTHLKRLVAHLASQGYTERFFELGRELVKRSPTTAEAENLVNALVRYQRHAEIGLLLADIPELIPLSPMLRSARAWNAFRDGDVDLARSIVDALRLERNDEDDRTLFVNILILSGRWPELSKVVEDQWTAREARSADELMRTAQIAHEIGSARTTELLQYAAARSNDDSQLLLTAYTLAVQMGRETELGAFSWFEAAAQLSGDQGPVQTIDLAELAERAPEWQKQVDDVWNMMRRAEIPLPIAAEALRQPSLELLLGPMIANLQRSDPRQRLIVSAFSGTRRNHPEANAALIAGGPIALDGSAIVTLAKLGRLETIVNRQHGVLLPHSALSWMFLERQKLPFHQPSRIAAAQDLMRLIAGGKVHRFASHAPVDAALGGKIGRTLAAMLADAATLEAGVPPRYVIRPAPVTRVGSFLNEPVDLSAHAASLRSCQSVVETLAGLGALTEAQVAEAQRYLSRAEKRWPDEAPLADGADLYLDDLAVSYLRTTGLIEKLADAGFRIFVSDEEIATMEALVDAERRGRDMDNLIGAMRETLAHALQTGAARLDRLFDEDGVKSHPNISVIQLASDAAVVVSDDRYMNQHPFIDNDDARTPIWTSLDLLDALKDKGILDEMEVWADRTTLRQCGYMLIPSDRRELEHHLVKARVVDGELVETAELKAFRENLRLAQQRGWLVLMHEEPWLFGLMGDLAGAIRSQWQDGIADAVARARSRWLLRCADIRNWAGCLDGDPSNIARYGLVINFHRVLMNQDEPRSRRARKRMDKWLEEEILDDLKRDEPQVHAWLLEHIRVSIAVHADGGDDAE